MIQVTCGTCGLTFMAEDRHAGRRAKCPECGALVMLTGAAQPAPPPKAAPGYDEPWFYGFADTCAQVIFILLLIAIVVAIFMCLNIGSFTGLIYFVIVLAGLVPTVLMAALMRLAVDAARNLRAIRRGIEKGDG
jgi:hypothetical protein